MAWNVRFNSDSVSRFQGLDIVRDSEDNACGFVAKDMGVLDDHRPNTSLNTNMNMVLGLVALSIISINTIVGYPVSLLDIYYDCE